MAAEGEDLGRSVLTLATDQRPLDAGLLSAERKTEESSRRMAVSWDNVGKKVAGVGQNMSRLGSNWDRTVTLPIVAGAAVAVKAASDFEGALTQIRTQAGASAKEIDNMRGALLKLAPALGQTPTQLANALYHIESAGQRGAAALDTLKKSAELAAIGHSDLEQTTSAVVAVMAAAPKDVKNASDAIGLLNATVGAGNMRLQDMVGALSTGILPSAKAAGLGLQDVGAAIAEMTKQGVPATDAATRLRMTISLMAAPTSQAATALASVGIKQNQLALDMRKPDGLVVALTDLKTHLGDAGLSATKQNALIAKAFGGGRSSSAVISLMQNVDDLKGKFDQIGKHSGAKQVTDAWKDTQKDVGFRLDQLKATAEKDAINIGTTLGPELLKVGTQVANDADKIVHAFTSLPKGAQDALITGGLIGAGLGPALKLLGVFTTGVGRLYDAAKIAGNLATGKGLGLAGKGENIESKLSSTVETMEVGTLIAKNMIGGDGAPGSTASKGASAAERDAEGAAGGAAGVGAAGEDALEIGRRATGAAAAGIVATGLGFISAAHADDNPVSKLIGFAKGADPTKVLSIFGIPALSDLLPAADKERKSLLRVLALGSAGVSGELPKNLSFGGKAQHDQLNQFKVDVAGAAMVLGNFTSKDRQVTLSSGDAIKSFANLAIKAQALGDVKYTFADKLAAELVKAKGVNSKGVNDLLGEMDKLPGGAKASAAAAMINMTEQFEDKGKVALGSTEELRAKIVQSYDQMGSQVVAKVATMASAVRNGSQTAARNAATYLGDFTTNVQQAVNQGAISMGQGMNILITNLNRALVEMGQKKLSAVQVGSLAITTGKQAELNRHNAATGGLFSVGRDGYPGRDTVGLNVGGIPIMVGEGEKVAVFNRHQWPAINARLADEGGLPGFFAARRKPNYMATGGLVAQDTLQSPSVQGTGTIADIVRAGLKDATSAARKLLPPTPVFKALNAAQTIAARNEPYITGGYGYNAPGLDCSGYVSTVMNAAGLMNGYLITGPLKHWGDEGNGKWITVGVRGADSGPGGHTMMEIAGKYFESSGHFAGGGPHVDSGWSESFPWRRHPAGLASGGVIDPRKHPQLTQRDLARLLAGDRSVLAQYNPDINPAMLSRFASGGMVVRGPVSTFGPPGEAAGSTYFGYSDTKPGISLRIPGTHWNDPRNHALGKHMFRVSIAGHSADLEDIDLGPNEWTGRDIDVTGAGVAALGIPYGSFPTNAIGTATELGAGVTATPPRSSAASSAAAKRKQAFIEKNRRLKGLLSPKARKPQRHRSTGGSIATGGTAKIGIGGPFPFISTDLGAINAVLQNIYGLDGGDSSGVGGDTPGAVTKLSSVLDWNTNNFWTSGLFPDPNFSSAGSPGDFVLSNTDAAGNTSYSISPNINQVSKQLGQAIDWDTNKISLLENTQQLTHALEPAIRNAINRRKALIAAIRKRIQANLQKIASLRAKIRATQQSIKAASIGKHPNWKQINQWSRSIAGWEGQISSLQAENQQLGGQTGVVGAGGEIGALSGQLGAAGTTDALTIAEGNGASATGLNGLLGTVTGWDNSLVGVGGEIPSEKITLAGWKSNLAGLLPGADTTLASSLAGSTSSTPTTDNSALLSLLQQQAQTSEAAFLVSQAQYKVLNSLGDLPPFGGVYHSGGTIGGGRIGDERTIIAQVGERITPIGSNTGGQNTFHVIVHDGAVDSRKIQVIANGEAQRVSRTNARAAAVRRPSAGSTGRF